MRSNSSLRVQGGAAKGFFAGVQRRRHLVLRGVDRGAEALALLGGQAASVFIASANGPFLPSAATRTASSAARSLAASISARIEVLRASMSVMIVIYTNPSSRDLIAESMSAAGLDPVVKPSG